jgi:hypothetical protein
MNEWCQMHIAITAGMPQFVHVLGCKIEGQLGECEVLDALCHLTYSVLRYPVRRM